MFIHKQSNLVRLLDQPTRDHLTFELLLILEIFSRIQEQFKLHLTTKTRKLTSTFLCSSKYLLIARKMPIIITLRTLLILKNNTQFLMYCNNNNIRKIIIFHLQSTINNPNLYPSILSNNSNSNSKHTYQTRKCVHSNLNSKNLSK